MQCNALKFALSDFIIYVNLFFLLLFYPSNGSSSQQLPPVDLSGNRCPFLQGWRKNCQTLCWKLLSVVSLFPQENQQLILQAKYCCWQVSARKSHVVILPAYGPVNAVVLLLIHLYNHSLCLTLMDFYSFHSLLPPINFIFIVSPSTHLSLQSSAPDTLCMWACRLSDNTRMQQRQTLHPSLDKRRRAQHLQILVHLLRSDDSDRQIRASLWDAGGIKYVLKKQNLTSPFSLQEHPLHPVFKQTAYIPSTKTPPPSLQTPWSFHIDGVHAEGHDTRITCLSRVSG